MQVKTYLVLVVVTTDLECWLVIGKIHRYRPHQPLHLWKILEKINIPEQFELKSGDKSDHIYRAIHLLIEDDGL